MFIFSFFPGRFETSGSMIPLSVSEISWFGAFCDLQKDEELGILVVGFTHCTAWPPPYITAGYSTDEGERHRFNTHTYGHTHAHTRAHTDNLWLKHKIQSATLASCSVVQFAGLH